MLAAIFYGLCGVLGAALEFCGLAFVKGGIALHNWACIRIDRRRFGDFLDQIEEEDLR